MVVTAGFPDRSAVGHKILTFLEPYQILFGLDQTWSMFAPNPSNLNSYLTATITFKDGSTEKWTFPRASQMDPGERFTAGEKYRKYQQENLVPMQKTELWYDLSRYVAREVSKIERGGRGRELAEITFYRHTNLIQPPDRVFVPHGKMATNYSPEKAFEFKPTGEMRYEANNNN